eukprot:gnl/Spiro4/3910_TR1940_c0_g1_i1.p1 gnl/Spiro4/3910_TR1940_c0_g1~~gnl/Spiro4/3910_TR1940_c0_g1_i1.p1  ORF type:complete len:318 (+),score=99.10 gnl/Spiro4/3910_TR1940_c0_g1_i1:34-987(+)
MDGVQRLTQKQEELNALVASEIAKIAAERQSLEEEKAAWQQTATKLDRTVVSGRIRLDVGGTVFATTLSTLTRLPNNFFAAMFSGRFALKPEADGSLFIDRDPFVFRHILNFLRGETVNVGGLSAGECEALLKDVDFYQIGELAELLHPPQPPFLAQFTAGRKYTLSADNTVATKSSAHGWDNVVLGHPLPRCPVFKFRFTLTNGAEGSNVMLGIAPSAVDRNSSEVYRKSGWYLYCSDCKLYSGSGAIGKAYGASAKLASGAVVDVELDRAQRTISFTVNGQSRGPAFRGEFAADDVLCPCASIYDSAAAVCISLP